jgi:hypothetical protein
LIGRIVSATRQRRAQKLKEPSADRAARRTAQATVAIAVFTAVAAAIGIAQWWILSGQLEEMRVDRRAWLSLEIEPTRFEVVRDRVGGPYITLKVTAKNVGKSPAQQVTISEVTHVPVGPEQGGFTDLVEKQCGRFPMTGFASLLVPGDSTAQNILVPFNRQQILDAWSKPGEEGRKAFNALPIICVIYKVTSDGDVHLIGAITQVEKLTEERSATFSILGRYGD